VTKVWQRDDVPHSFARARAASREGTVLVEEMLIGVESSAEAFVAGDRIELLGICDKTKCAPPYSFDLRLIYPACFGREVLYEIRVLNERIIRAIGIRLGITHAEYIVTPKGVRLLEIAARGCGARVATDLLPALTGVDPIRARIRQALGQDADLGTPRQGCFGLLQFLMLPAGRVKAIAGLDEARRLPGVLDVGLLVNAGDCVGVIADGAARPGYVLAVGDSRDAVLASARRVTDTVRIEMENRFS
jgi:biotin carboxylase